MCPFNLTTLRTLNAVAAHRQGQRIAIISVVSMVTMFRRLPRAARAFNAYARRRSTARAETQNVGTLFSKFSDHWSPKIAGEINSMHLKLVKVQGDFVWHHHDTEDELFLVTKGGPLHMKIRDPDERTEVVDVGEFIIIPKGVEHCPMAVNECEIILLEPKSTLNTGNVKNDEKTVELLDTLV